MCSASSGQRAAVPEITASSRNTKSLKPLVAATHWEGRGCVYKEKTDQECLQTDQTEAVWKVLFSVWGGLVYFLKERRGIRRDRKNLRILVLCFYVEIYKVLYMLNGEEGLSWPREINKMTAGRTMEGSELLLWPSFFLKCSQMHKLGKWRHLLFKTCFKQVCPYVTFFKKCLI